MNSIIHFSFNGRNYKLIFIKKTILGECMMNTMRLFNENDVEILNDGISVKNTFFSKKQIADTFNELILVRDFIDKQTG